MTRLRIRHETIYQYKNAVQFGPHRLVIRPREGHDTRIEEMGLEIEPEFELAWSRDLFGNSIAVAHFLSSSDRLRICSEVVLKQTEHFLLPSSRLNLDVRIPLEFSEIESLMAGAYLATIYPKDQPRVDEWVRETIGASSGHSAEQILMLVAQGIRDTVQYRRREIEGVQSPALTISLGSGSCRDMATLMLEVLRTLGLPARFVSGYLESSASKTGLGVTHAWAEAYLPSIGWIGYDPMLGQPISGAHVVVGVSNHPRGVMPVSGTFFGERNSFLQLEVAVTTSRLANSEARMLSAAR